MLLLSTTPNSKYHRAGWYEKGIGAGQAPLEPEDKHTSHLSVRLSNQEICYLVSSPVIISSLGGQEKEHGFCVGQIQFLHMALPATY